MRSYTYSIELVVAVYVFSKSVTGTAGLLQGLFNLCATPAICGAQVINNMPTHAVSQVLGAYYDRIYLV